ncbi:outer membrane protein assembly factor BamA [candidate division KSB3 bacterium]|uniref:Outer membrane protein assembly factor BamA n=1 Tax=candidate division KSB3 bacterium TaxID=2044937 RepID=A0A9D5JU24_9BACT|nr:outer membrane protein assembly factor BamA [candidate division KSB3 bacterium]MBD3324242.1 outer membrane protein assembly factor BamA [candidate division KSB3 bacterium]
MTVTDRDVTYNFETAKADLTLTISEGQATQIRFEGNTQIKTKTLRNQINLFTQTGTWQDILTEAVEQLTALYHAKGYPFAQVSYQQTEQDGAPVVTFTIEEGAQVHVETITIEGNDAFKDSEITDQMLTTTDGIFSSGIYHEKVFEEDLLAIKALYQKHGYLEAEVVTVTKEFSADQQRLDIHLVIQEGVQTRIDTIRILGVQDEALVEPLHNQLTIHEDDPLDVNQVTESITQIREFYANRGYIQAEVDVSTQFSDDKRHASITLTISRGQQFFVGNISIQGVIRTRKEFIARELQIHEGDVYNPQKIRETVRRLLQLGLYESVTFRRLDTKSTDPVQDMLLSVRETPAKTVEFGIGYSTETDFKGFVEYADKNILNHGGRGTARLEASIERPKVTLKYLHPHIVTQDTSIVLSIFDDLQKDNESFEIEKRGGRIAVQHNFDPTLSASLGYYFEIADPSDVKEDAVLSKLDTAILNLAGVDFRISWDVRDNLIVPKSGGFSQFYLRSSFDAVGAETEFFEVGAQTNWYLRLFDGVIAACSLNGRLIDPILSADAVPIYARYFLGGETSVRGFQKYSIGPVGTEGHRIGGDRMVALRAELRFPIYSVLGGVLFCDAGANWLDDAGFDADDFREAAGAGLRVLTPVGPLRFDYGWKLDRQSGESASEYYITIGSAF